MSVLDAVPTRQQLLQHLESTNRSAWFWIWLQVLACLVLVAFIDWQAVVDEPLIPLVAISVTLSQTALGVLALWARKKKNIEDLRDSTRFGEFDKHRLQRMYQETLGRLRLPHDRLPVYIVNNKSLNAAAVRLSLGGLFRSLNGIYLNRQILHKLSSAEIQNIMGHELGHYYRHFVLIDRFRFITLFLGALLGTFVAQRTGLEDLVGVVILMGVIYGLFWISGLPWARNIQAVEFLCDDYGAHVNGIEPSINGLMKIGAEEEMLLAVQAQVLARRKANANLGIQEIATAVENMLPYGQTTQAELQSAVDRELKQSSPKASVADFIDYIWNGDADEDEIEELEMLAVRLQSQPRIPWETLLPSEQIAFDLPAIEQLVKMIENQPGHVLVRATLTNGSHPSLKRRILYLWKNRHGIESERKQLGLI